MKNYGLIIPEIETREQGAEHILGSASGVDGPVINPSGDWRDFLPDKEPQQKRGIETQACTAYATLNAIETLIFQKTGKRVNYSDRYLAIVGKIDPYKGADPHQIAECIRKTAGCLKEERLPFADDISTPEGYYGVPEHIILQLMQEGERWYDEWDFNHKWVFRGGKPNEKRLSLQEALTKGTVCISVSAWFYENEKNYYYKPEGTRDNHWTQLAAAPPNRYFIFDSYDGYLKEADGLYDFAIAKVFYLEPSTPKTSFLSRLFSAIAQTDLLKRIINSLYPMESKEEPKPEPVIEPKEESPAEKLYRVSKANLGQKLSPKNPVLGCAEAVNAVHKLAFGDEIGGDVSTYRLWEAIKKRKDFIEVPEYEVGAVIISPTGSQPPNSEIAHGHTGICGNFQIMSNNSLTGQWDTHFTKERWNDYYKKVGGYPVIYFRKVADK